MSFSAETLDCHNPQHRSFQPGFGFLCSNCSRISSFAFRISHQSSGWFAHNPAIFEYRSSAQNGLDDFRCQLAADIWTLAMAVEQSIAFYGAGLIQIHQREVGIRACDDPAFGRRQLKDPGNALRKKPGEERPGHSAFPPLGQQQRKRMLHARDAAPNFEKVRILLHRRRARRMIGADGADFPPLKALPQFLLLVRRS